MFCGVYYQSFAQMEIGVKYIDLFQVPLSQNSLFLDISSFLVLFIDNKLYCLIKKPLKIDSKALIFYTYISLF